MTIRAVIVACAGALALVAADIAPAAFAAGAESVGPSRIVGGRQLAQNAAVGAGPSNINRPASQSDRAKGAGAAKHGISDNESAVPRDRQLSSPKTAGPKAGLRSRMSANEASASGALKTSSKKTKASTKKYSPETGK